MEQHSIHTWQGHAYSQQFVCPIQRVISFEHCFRCEPERCPAIEESKADGKKQN